MTLNTFPSRPFDFQLWSDRYNVLWRFNIEERCWRRAGVAPSIPIASSSQSGLLSAQLKTLTDSIPEKGGHFGIVVQPFLSTVQFCPEKLFEGTVETVTIIPSGTAIKVIEEISEDSGTGGVDWSGMVLRFEKGVLKGQQFIIYEVQGRTIKVLGDASLAENGDTLGVLEPKEADRVGLITGDIEMVSDSLDIACVTGSDGDVIDVECAEPLKFPDTLDDPPGFDVKVGQTFLNTFCIQVPGCKGPRGEPGEKGRKGLDGTSDGPRGEKGEAGKDATEAHKFTGIKIIESDEVYDTAVVSLELDSAAGKLTAVKSKVKVPTEEDAADQLITTPIHRAILWACLDFNECLSPNLDIEEDGFAAAMQYELSAPPDDPLDVLDVTLGYYAKGVEIGGDPEELNTSRTLLSVLIDKVIDYYVNQLHKIEEKWNTQAKDFMTAKDREARQILSGLILKLAECEWELPIEFCFGIQPGDCHPGPTGAVQEEDLARMPMASFLLGDPFCEDSLAESLGDYAVPAGTGTDTPGIRVQYPANNIMGSETLPEGGYVIQYLRGTFYDSNHPDHGYFVGNPECDNCGDVSQIGLTASYDVEGGGPEQSEIMPQSTAPHDKYDQASVETAYQNGPLLDKAITPIFTGTGIITLSAPVGPDADASGDVVVRVLRVFPCSGTGFKNLDDYSPDELGHRDIDEGTIVEAD